MKVPKNKVLFRQPSRFFCMVMLHLLLTELSPILELLLCVLSFCASSFAVVFSLNILSLELKRSLLYEIFLTLLPSHYPLTKI